MPRPMSSLPLAGPFNNMSKTMADINSNKLLIIRTAMSYQRHPPWRGRENQQTPRTSGVDAIRCPVPTSVEPSVEAGRWMDNKKNDINVIMLKIRSILI